MHDEALHEPPLDALRALCPLCRRLVAAGAPCTVDGAAVLSITEPAGRDGIVERIWGAAEERARLSALRQQRTSRRMGVGLATAVATFGVGFASLGQPVFCAGLGVVFGAFGAASAGTRAMRLIPADAAPPPTGAAVARGRIAEAAEVIALGSRERCVAYAVELHLTGSWGVRTTLRIGATAGFDVVLDGGERVRIRPGALWISGRLPQVDGDDALIDDLMHVLDPAHATSEWPLFPYNVILEQTLVVGDRVEICGAVESRPALDEEARTYRDAAPSVLVHTGLPIVRLAPGMA